MNEHDASIIGASSMGYLAGLTIGSKEHAHLAPFEPIIAAIAARHGQVLYQKIKKPIPAQNAVSLIQHTMREALGTFVYGFFDSAAYSIGKSVELALGEAFTRDEGKPPPDKLEARLNWFGSKDSQNKLLGSSIQLLRNTIHSSNNISEQTALEALRNGAEVIMAAFPYAGFTFSAADPCRFCGKPGSSEVPIEFIYYGNTIPFTCDACKSTYFVQIEW
jgi:hypothetical protein